MATAPYIDQLSTLGNDRQTGALDAFRAIADNDASSAADVAEAAARLGIDLSVAKSILESMGKGAKFVSDVIESASRQ